MYNEQLVVSLYQIKRIMNINIIKYPESIKDLVNKFGISHHYTELSREDQKLRLIEDGVRQGKIDLRD